VAVSLAGETAVAGVESRYRFRHAYARGSLSDSDFRGKRGRLRLGVEKKKGFPDRNIIADYVCDAEPSSGSGFFAGNGAKAR
jgi:hypothetical protein